MAFTPEHKKQPGPERVKERWPCDIFSSPPAGGQILSPGEQSSSTEAFLLVTMVITCVEPGQEGRLDLLGARHLQSPSRPLRELAIWDPSTHMANLIPLCQCSVKRTTPFLCFSHPSCRQSGPVSLTAYLQAFICDRKPALCVVRVWSGLCPGSLL